LENPLQSSQLHILTVAQKNDEKKLKFLFGIFCCQIDPNFRFVRTILIFFLIKSHLKTSRNYQNVRFERRLLEKNFCAKILREVWYFWAKGFAYKPISFNSQSKWHHYPNFRWGHIDKTYAKTFTAFSETLTKIKCWIQPQIKPSFIC
jgi:hypothetical protein